LISLSLSSSAELYSDQEELKKTIKQAEKRKLEKKEESLLNARDVMHKNLK